MDFGSAGPRLRAAASLAYPVARETLLASPAGLRRVVRTALRQGSFSGRRVVTCLPAAQVKVMPIHYRVGTGKDEGETVYAHAVERLDGDAADWIIDYLPVRTSGAESGERSALATCAQRVDVLAYLDRLHGAGLQVAALEVGPVAIRRLVVSANDAEVDANVLCMNFGRRRTYLSAISGRRLLLDREVSLGESELIDKLAVDLEVPPAQARRLVYRHGMASGAGARREQAAGGDEVATTIADILRPRFLDLAAEVERLILYAAAELRGAGVDRVYLLGGIARWPGIERYLDGLLPLAVRILDPFASFGTEDPAPTTAELDPVAGFAVATGCALRGSRADD